MQTCHRLLFAQDLSILLCVKLFESNVFNGTYVDSTLSYRVLTY
jgi:hypothetical protein